MIVGDWAYPQYEDAFARGLDACSIEICALSTLYCFQGFWGRLQRSLPAPGPALHALNAAVISEVKKQMPDLILFWRPTHIKPQTLQFIANMGIKTVSYNNDDPFGPIVHGNVPWHHHFLWSRYLKCLPWFDYNFFYRKINCIEAKVAGAKHAAVLLPYFMPWRDRAMQLSIEDHQRYDTDVVFVGHYESDGREKSIRALITAGIRVKIWGGHYWSRAVLGDIYDRLSPIVQAEGSEYAKALSGAKVCLCFLSSLNRDTYTRRCFEIPACGKVMLAERTDDLMQFFKEDEEACFFSSTDELIVKARWLIENPDIRSRIAQAGLRRVWESGHDVTSRAREFIKSVS
jgi:spore maturation protein CgeB